MKKTKSRKNITDICEKLRSEFSDWESIPTKVPADGRKEREELYQKIKEKMENLSD